MQYILPAVGDICRPIHFPNLNFPDHSTGGILYLFLGQHNCVEYKSHSHILRIGLQWNSHAICFWKHKFALINQIWLILVVWPNLGKVFWKTCCYFLGFWNLLYCRKPGFWIYIEYKSFVTLIVRYFTVSKNFIKQQQLWVKILKLKKMYFSWARQKKKLYAAKK